MLEAVGAEVDVLEVQSLKIDEPNLISDVVGLRLLKHIHVGLRSIVCGLGP